MLRIGKRFQFAADGQTHTGVVVGTFVQDSARWARVRDENGDNWVMDIHGDFPGREQ